MKIKSLMIWAMAAVLLAMPVTGVRASDGEEYVTITVQASDDNEGITYALDSDDPGSFGPSNIFTVPAGTSHTIYVKDAAGNITSQIYEPEPEESGQAQPDTETTETETVKGSYYPTEENSTEEYSPEDYTYTYSSSTSDDGQTIDIDLELKKAENADKDEKPYELKRDAPAEQGEGTVYSKTFLDGTDSSEQVFYSMTTAEGDVFYLLVDQGQESNNVYLLNQVNNQDLVALAVDGEGGAASRDDQDDSLLKALSSGNGNDESSPENSKKAEKGGINKSSIILLLLIAAAGGFYYYQKVYKAKKEQEMDAMEAPDMDQFSAEPDTGEDDDFEFGYGDDDADQYLADLMAQDEADYAAKAQSESAGMGWDDNDDQDDSEENGVDDIFSDAGTDGKYDPDNPDDDIFSDAGTDGEYDPEIDGED